MRTHLAIAALAATAAPALASFTYALDDGSGNINIGPPSSFDQFDNTDLIWGNYFNADPVNNIITSIDINFGSFSTEPRDVTLLIWNDTNNDADPTDINAAPLASFNVSATSTPIGEFDNFQLPTPVAVDGGFFVAAAVRNAVPGGEAAANLDPDSPGDNSWLIYSPDLDESDLASSIGFASPTNNPAFFAFEGAWTLRANAVPAPGAAALIAFASAAASRRRR